MSATLRRFAAAGSGPALLRRSLARGTSALQDADRSASLSRGLAVRLAPGLLGAELTPLLGAELGAYLADGAAGAVQRRVRSPLSEDGARAGAARIDEGRPLARRTAVPGGPAAAAGRPAATAPAGEGVEEAARDPAAVAADPQAAAIRPRTDVGPASRPAERSRDGLAAADTPRRAAASLLAARLAAYFAAESASAANREPTRRETPALEAADARGRPFADAAAAPRAATAVLPPMFGYLGARRESASPAATRGERGGAAAAVDPRGGADAGWRAGDRAAAAAEDDLADRLSAILTALARREGIDLT